MALEITTPIMRCCFRGSGKTLGSYDTRAHTNENEKYDAKICLGWDVFGVFFTLQGTQQPMPELGQEKIEGAVTTERQS